MSERPKSLVYKGAVSEAEQRIVDALPDILDGLIARAREGDVKAAVYLCDRILGRAAGSKAAPADDQSVPFTDDIFSEERELAQLNRDRLLSVNRIEANVWT